MSLNEEIQKYINEESGLVKAPDGDCANLILNSAILLELLWDLGEGSDWKNWHYKCREFIEQNEIIEGLYNRRKGFVGKNSVDNYVAICSVHLIYAVNVMNYGIENKWCFNAEQPGKWNVRNWYGRFIGFPPFVKMKANFLNSKKRGRWLFFGRFLWAVACVYSALTPKMNTSDKRLQWLMNKNADKRFLSVRVAIWIWKKIMTMRYPGGMKDVFKIYDGPEHPFTKYARSDFE